MNEGVFLANLDKIQIFQLGRKKRRISPLKFKFL